MDIRVGELRNKAVIALLQEHHKDMLSLSPPESVHALDLSSLEQPDITFWSLWFDQELAGIGALKQLSEEHGEIKSMRTSRQHLRQGVAATILNYIIQQSTLRSYKKLSLETGTMDAFIAAHQLYHQFGFYVCEPFGDYQDDPHSLFMSKTLTYGEPKVSPKGQDLSCDIV